MTTDSNNSTGREPGDRPASGDDTRFARLEQRLGRTIPVDQEALVRAALAANDVIWAARDVTSVPDGMEPASLFIPIRPSGHPVAETPAREEGGYE